MLRKIYFTIIICLIASRALTMEGLKTISAEEFISENPSAERQSIVDFIVHQFDNNRESGISQEALSNLWNNIEARKALHMTRFQIVDQKLYADSFAPERSNYFQRLATYLQKILENYKINNLDLIIYIRDEIPKIDKIEKQVKATPAFLMSKNTSIDEEKDMFLLPNAAAIIPPWKETINKINIAKDLSPWNKKINKIFFRGFLTGGSSDIDSPNISPRLTLSILSKLYPNLIDSKLTAFHRIIKDPNGKYIRHNERNKQSIADFLFGPQTPINVQEGTLYRGVNVPEEDHLKYKYLMSIDGNTCAWVRPVWIMSSNSVLVKQETNNIEWFYPALKPYVHYVPVNERLTDIFQQLDWMKSHDEELQQISRNAQNFVENNLMPEHIDAHTVIILNEYHKLHKGAKIIPTLPTVEETLAKEKIASPEPEKLGRKKRLKRFFKNIEEKIKSLWS